MVNSADIIIAAFDSKKFLLFPIWFVFGMIGFYLYMNWTKNAQIERAVRQETGERHLAKKHIPDTAGQVMIALCFIALLCIFAIRSAISSYLLLFPVLFGVTGLMDDLTKNKSADTKGIPARYRIIIQAVLATGFILYLMHILNGSGIYNFSNLMAFLLVILIMGTANASNFTDGLDGLLTGISLIIILGFLAIFMTYPSMLGIYPDVTPDMYLYFFAGIMVSFLYFNRHPARMFMGDGGSMLIGSFLVCFAIWSRLEVFLVIAAIPIFIELLSVVIQVISFRTTGKRLFPITPIHHSFEKWGWKEKNIVFLFYAVTVVTTITGYVVVSLFSEKMIVTGQ